MSDAITPYFIRAIYEWCCDQGYAPLIVVKDGPAALLPQAYVKEGEITLNIGPTAIKALQMGNDFIEFSARFGGVAQNVRVPIGYVAGIFARETGQGMNFVVDLAVAPAPAAPDTPQAPKDIVKPSFKVLK